jgi:hypothetical protein
MQASLTARQRRLGKFPFPHPVERKALVTGCRSIVSLSGFLG